MELTSAINLRASPGHPRWEWALVNGLNELLVCLASAPMEICEADGDVTWHEDAEFWPPDQAATAADEPALTGAAITGSSRSIANKTGN